MDELKRRCEELRRESARLKGELAARKRANRPLQEQLALKKAQLRKALTAVETLKKLRAHLEASAPGEGPGGYGDMGEGGGGTGAPPETPAWDAFQQNDSNGLEICLRM